MATLMAANSDSTLMNSQLAISPLDHFAEAFDDVRLRRNRIGADYLWSAKADRFGNGV
jgi:hypothetical protein